MTAYLTNQPFELERRGIPYQILNPQDYGINFYGNNLFASETETVNKPDRVRRFVRASSKGWLYALSHKEEIVDLILAKYTF